MLILEDIFCWDFREVLVMASVKAFKHDSSLSDYLFHCLGTTHHYVKKDHSWLSFSSLLFPGFFSFQFFIPTFNVILT